MENVIPMLIRCPKCLKVLSEIPGTATYKCGGCGAILQDLSSVFADAAQVDSNSGKTSTSASTASSSKNMSDTGSFENEITDFGKETLSVSYHSGTQDQVLKAKVSDAVGELNIMPEFSENGTKNSVESEFDPENLKERRRSQDQNGVSLTDHNLNGKGKKFLQHSVSAKHAVGDDKMFQNIRNESSFLLRSRSSHVNFPRRAISRFDFPARERDFSPSSEDFLSALNITGSENGGASESRSKDTKQPAKFRHPEKIDHAKILRKVDELRIELRRYFDRGASRFSTSARSEGKFPSSFVPPSEPPDVVFLHNEHRGGRPHNVSSHPYHRDPHYTKTSDKRSREFKFYCRPVSGGAPFVICTKCHNLLQLPADFLLLTKRIHKLRCGACSEVLRYTFRPKDVPTAQAPSEAQLPPIKAGKSLVEILHDEIASSPRLAYIREVEPIVAYSDGSNSSFGKSSSHGSIVEEDHSRKSSRRSQLHRLMGYSSARFLLFNTFSSSEGSRTEHDR